MWPDPITDIRNWKSKQAMSRFWAIVASNHPHMQRRCQPGGLARDQPRVHRVTLGAMRKASVLKFGMIIGTAVARHPKQPRLVMCSRSTSPILGQGP